MSGLQRILVPTDFSPASDIALQYAIDLAQCLGSQLHLLHVIDDRSFAVGYPDGAFVPAVPELRERLVAEANHQLGNAAARCITAGLRTTTEAAIGGPARVIAQTAGSRETDLVVMGTHGRGAVAHLLLGSVAERVIRTAPCAVLTVRDSTRLADTLAAERSAATNVAPVSS